MWGTCALVWGRVGTLVVGGTLGDGLGVGGTLGDGGNTLGSDRGETVEVIGGETDGEALAEMVAK